MRSVQVEYFAAFDRHVKDKCFVVVPVIAAGAAAPGLSVPAHAKLDSLMDNAVWWTALSSNLGEAGSYRTVQRLSVFSDRSATA